MSSRSKQSTQNTRQRILDVSARLFSERGYAGTSVRDIAAELGIRNPSLYYHFESKEKILLELLTEPLMRVKGAVAEAEQLSGNARTRRIIAGLLEALEVHSGIAVMAGRELEQIGGDERYRYLPRTMSPSIKELLSDGVTEDRRDLRLTMAIGAVEGVVRELMRNAENSEAFVAALRSHREDVIDLTLQILC